MIIKLRLWFKILLIALNCLILSSCCWFSKPDLHIFFVVLPGWSLDVKLVLE